MFKRITATLVSVLCLCTPFSGARVLAEQNLPEEIKILCIGNSFSCDTIEHVANIALSLGVKKVTLGNLYIGGCSIKKHYANATADNKTYEYFQNNGSGWTSSYNHSIKATLESEDWDYVSIQHGTLDGSRYAEQESYKDLPALIGYIRQYVPSTTKIVFNMTWVGEPNSHEEMIAFGNDQLKYYQAVAKLTSTHIASVDGVDIISPTGTSIQNARTAEVGLLTRDNYHLSLGLGRYIAGLTFFKALSGADISNIKWAPQGLSEYKKEVAIESVNNTFKNKFSVTESRLVPPEFSWPSDLKYGEAATPDEPHYEHAAKTAPNVESKVNLLGYFNLSESTPAVSSTLESANGLGLNVDLTKTPYLYYSFAIPDGSDFCFSIYSDSNYSPWLSFLDASKGGATLSESAETWDALFKSRAQYATKSVSGCIDLRDYAKADAKKWVISRLKLYAPKGEEVIVSYFFLGSEPIKTPDVSEDVSEEVSDEVSEEVSENVSKDVSEDISQDASQNVSPDNSANESSVDESSVDESSLDESSLDESSDEEEIISENESSNTEQAEKESSFAVYIVIGAVILIAAIAFVVIKFKK